MVWQYLLTAPLDGKKPGWHPYTQEASNKLTSLQLQSIQSNRERTIYQVKSGYFTYQVNTIVMTQRNISRDANWLRLTGFETAKEAKYTIRLQKKKK